ncbi:MAG TPA: hypothetical protein VIY28_10980 [Pseudonocardiaceae bacterium]
MNATNGHGDPGAGTGVAAARPVALVRYCPGVVGETTRTVHVVPLPTDGQVGAVGALCGAALLLDDIETVIPGEGHALHGLRRQPRDGHHHPDRRSARV